MAPADSPRLVIAVILQRPTNGYYGGQVAAPVFQQVMTYALAQRKVPADRHEAPRHATELAVRGSLPAVPIPGGPRPTASPAHRLAQVAHVGG